MEVKEKEKNQSRKRKRREGMYRSRERGPNQNMRVRGSIAKYFPTLIISQTLSFLLADEKACEIAFGPREISQFSNSPDGAIEEEVRVTPLNLLR